MKKNWLLVFCLSVFLCLASPAYSQNAAGNQFPRQRLRMDTDWRFSFGHATYPTRDFNFRNAWNLAKAGLDYSNLFVAGVDFNDLGWRQVDLPHDWALELPHGFTQAPLTMSGFDSSLWSQNGWRQIGLQYPESAIGWYRRTFDVPASDRGKRLWIEFDGVHRDSYIFLNGFMIGRHQSGYTSFRYDVTDYVNYGGKNAVTVRCDATQFEGWWYEGAGIYRHVWLVKTSPQHVTPWGTQVISDVKANAADLTAKTRLANDSNDAVRVDLVSTVLDAQGHAVAQRTDKAIDLAPWQERELAPKITVARPRLWSLEDPNLYRLVTEIKKGSAVVDRYETPFGIRTIQFDANRGFFLNGKRVEIRGAANHQDAGGVGEAVPDALYDYRVRTLKSIGCNAWRCAHNPPAPELLEACDRLGMLVMDESRRCGSTPEALADMESIVLRDRNHPSVILWSIGNEEAPMQGNIVGERVAATVRRHIKEWDGTRYTTAADNGLDPNHGFSVTLDVAGVNYPESNNNGAGVDAFHKQNPTKPIMGTEGGWKQATRGTYQNDARGRIESYNGLNLDQWWKVVAARPYMAGGMVWTGFDYRGETHGQPPLNNSSGILDLCGFMKDQAYYLKSWWVNEPVLHVMPHWNWAGREGQTIDVRVLSNCEAVELFLNGTSLGRQKMAVNGQLKWNVKYAPGTLLARGFKGGREIITDKVETTGAPASIRLIPDRKEIRADGEDLAVVRVEVLDAQSRIVPTADAPLQFALQGPGHLLGVCNGDPDDREPERYVETVTNKPITDWLSKRVEEAKDYPEVRPDYPDADWKPIHIGVGGAGEATLDAPGVAIYRTVFEATEAEVKAPQVSLNVGYVDDAMKMYLNGKLIAETSLSTTPKQFDVKGALRVGRNQLAVVHTNTQGGGVFGHGVALATRTPAAPWSHRAFNGLAQVLVQTGREAGPMQLTVRSPGLREAVLNLQAKPAEPRPIVP